MEHGYQVLLAGDGEKALSLVDAIGKELTHVIVDIALPAIGGYQVIYEIQRRLREIRVIAMTDAANEYYLEIAKTMGAYGALRKPPGGDVEAERTWHERIRQLL
jgi:CheY-like chemotaxis protein